MQWKLRGHSTVGWSGQKLPSKHWRVWKNQSINPSLLSWSQKVPLADRTVLITFPCARYTQTLACWWGCIKSVLALPRYKSHPQSAVPSAWYFGVFHQVSSMWPHNHNTICVNIHNPIGEQIVNFLDQVSKLPFAGEDRAGHPWSKIKDIFRSKCFHSSRSCQWFGSKSKQKLTFVIPESSGRQPDNELRNEQFWVLLSRTNIKPPEILRTNELRCCAIVN